MKEKVIEIVSKYHFVWSEDKKKCIEELTDLFEADNK